MKNLPAHIITGGVGNSTVHATGILEAETQKAVLISGIWFPKSQLTHCDRHEDQVGFFFQDWIVDKKWSDIVDAGIAEK